MLDINNISQYIDLSIEQQEEELRPHFGCSSAGGACDRLAWLKFRWAVIPKHSGRIKRIFRRGHNEEKFVIDDLAKIGIKVAGTGNDRIFEQPECNRGFEHSLSRLWSVSDSAAIPFRCHFLLQTGNGHEVGSYPDSV